MGITCQEHWALENKEEIFSHCESTGYLNLEHMLLKCYILNQSKIKICPNTEGLRKFTVQEFILKILAKEALMNKEKRSQCKHSFIR